jgi:hypothetical protein
VASKRLYCEFSDTPGVPNLAWERMCSVITTGFSWVPVYYCNRFGSLGISGEAPRYGGTWAAPSSEQAIAFQVEENALEEMAQIEQSIAAPFEDLEFVVQPFNEATVGPVHKVIGDLFPPVL